MAERVGFGLFRLLWILQVTDSTMPGVPSMPALPWRLAPDCTHCRDFSFPMA
jgi:hypothetical protein